MSERDVLAWAMVLTLGCGRSPELALSPGPNPALRDAPRPVGAPNEDNACDGDATACGAGATLLRCSAGVWQVEQRCADLCAAQGRCSAGCGVTAAGAACLCTSGSSCGEQAACRDHGAVMDPDGARASCFARCREAGDARFSLGCGARTPDSEEACQCAALGEPCDMRDRGGCVGPEVESTAIFQVPSTDEIAQCVDGVWTAVRCADICGEPAAQCRHGGDDACHCADP